MPSRSDQDINQERKKIFFPLIPEKLDFLTQEKLQTIVDRATQVICMHLGIQLDDLEVFQDGLAHLNDQNVGRKDKLESHKDMYKQIIQPQMKALTALVQERLHPADWKVSTSPTPLAGDMIHVTIKSLKNDLRIDLYERGFQIDAPYFDVSWNIFPAVRDESEMGRNKDTHITIIQKDGALGLPAPIIKIQAHPTVPADGVLQLIHTDSERNGGRPSIGRALFPEKLSTQAAYTQDGAIRYLRVVFPIPGSDGRMNNTLVSTYDFRENVPKTGVQPVRSKKMTSEESFELPLNPEVSVEDGVLSLSYLGKTDTFPLQTEGVVKIAETALYALTKYFPTKEPLPTLPQGQE